MKLSSLLSYISCIPKLGNPSVHAVAENTLGRTTSLARNATGPLRSSEEEIISAPLVNYGRQYRGKFYELDEEAVSRLGQSSRHALSDAADVPVINITFETAHKKETEEENKTFDGTQYVLPAGLQPAALINTVNIIESSDSPKVMAPAPEVASDEAQLAQHAINRDASQRIALGLIKKPAVKTLVPVEDHAANGMQDARTNAETNPAPALNRLAQARLELMSGKPDRKIQSLETYLAEVEKKLALNEQPDENMSRLDMVNMPAIVESQNKQNGNLHLHYFKTVDQLAQHLTQTDSSQARETAVVCVSAPPGMHHLAIDISRKDGVLSLVAVDPLNIDQPHARDGIERMAATLEALVPDAKLAVIGAGIQKSPSDCAIFSLHFTEQMAADRGGFDQIHKDLAAETDTGAGTTVAGITTRSNLLLVKNSLQFLKIGFLEHAHTLERPNQFFEKQPELQENRSEFVAKREMKKRVGKEYNVSIELMRSSLIKNSIATLKEQEKSQPSAGPIAALAGASRRLPINRHLRPELSSGNTNPAAPVPSFKKSRLSNQF